MRLAERISNLEEKLGHASIFDWADEVEDRMMQSIIDEWRKSTQRGIVIAIGLTGETILIPDGQTRWQRPDRTTPLQPKPKNLTTSGYGIIVVPEKDDKVVLQVNINGKNELIFVKTGVTRAAASSTDQPS